MRDTKLCWTPGEPSRTLLTPPPSPPPPPKKEDLDLQLLALESGWLRLLLVCSHVATEAHGPGAVHAGRRPLQPPPRGGGRPGAPTSRTLPGAGRATPRRTGMSFSRGRGPDGGGVSRVGQTTQTSPLVSGERQEGHDPPPQQ